MQLNVTEIQKQFKDPLLTTRPTNSRNEDLNRIPDFRRPTAKQIKQMLPAVIRRGRLAVDPFTSITLLQKRNPEKIYK